MPTTQDTAVEGNETVPLNIGGVEAVGTINDDDSAPPTVTGIEPGQPGIADDGVTEGSTLAYTVTLSAPTTAPVTYPFALGGGTAGAGDFGTPTFTNGVALNPDGTITVPAGVSSFEVRVPTTQDSTVEGNETVPVTIGGAFPSVTGTGTIIDDDAPPSIKSVEVGGPGASDDAVVEGAVLNYTVTLSAAAASPTAFGFRLGGGTAQAGDFGAPVFSNGVTLMPNGVVVVPAGVTSFTVSVPTVQDTRVEATETLPLTIGGVVATGAIIDDDGTQGTPPTVTSVEPGGPGAGDDRTPEGQQLVYTVSLSGPTTAPLTLSFALGGGTASGADFGAPVFSNGVTLNPDGSITVPTGVRSFSVSVPSTQDSLTESDETVPLAVGGVSGNGTIVDDDAPPTVTSVEPGHPGVGDDQVTEGTALVYTVKLSGAAPNETRLEFALGGGSAAGSGAGADIGNPVFSNGVTLNADGSITVPAGVTSFTVTVPTVQDSTQEADETVPLRVGGVNATGVIVDDDSNAAPLVGNGSGSVSEEGLNGGLPDDTGSPVDGGNANTTSGRITISDPDGQPLGAPVLLAPPAALTSGGVAVTWAGSGTSTLTASAGADVVATAHINSDGSYSFTLLKPIDHATAQGENVQQLDITVQASDGQATGSGTLSIQIDDDAPVATTVTSAVNVAAVNTNLMLVLDVSGSMNEPSGLPGASSGQTRLQAAVASIKTVLDRYDEAGDVAVRLVTFGSEGQALGNSWTTVAQAKALLANLQASGSTNYDDALADAMQAYAAPGRIAGGQNVAYFVSDGQPTVGSGTTSTLSGTLNAGSAADRGIQAAEETLWTNFLTANGINAHAVSLGTDAATLSSLNPIAFNGLTQTNTGATAVANLADLTAALAPSAAAVTSGSLFAGGLGADGGHVHSFSVDGITYQFDPSANNGAGAVTASVSPAPAFSFDTASKTLQLDTAAGGHFSVDLDSGSYSYRAASSAVAGSKETFAYSLIDNDGDTAAATGSVQINGPSAPPPPPPPPAPPANLAPVVGNSSATVSEEGLAGGLADSTGSQGDRTNATTATGRVTISDPDGNAISSVVLTAPTAALSSGGQAVTWAGSGTHTLTASAGGQVVATASIDDQGNYSFKLLRPVDHASGNGENTQTLNIGVVATDNASTGKASGSGVLTVNIEDDAPQVGNANASLQSVHTNVMVVLDTSGSMGQAAPGLAMTRLQAAIKSIETLLDRYDAQGDVAVRLVGFSTEGKAMGDCWTSVAQAKTLMCTLRACGETNYDDALADAIAAFGSAGKIAGAQNVSYFLSDGDPTTGSGGTALSASNGCNLFGSGSLFTQWCGTSGNTATATDDKGIQAAEEKIWTDFLSGNRVNSFALAMGSDITNVSALNPVAYDGRAQTNTAATVVSNYADLSSALAQTSAGVASGKLFASTGTSTADGHVGADGGHVHSFSVDGVTYTLDTAAGGAVSISSSTPHAHGFDAQTQTLSVSTAAGGQFFVDMDGGGYVYRAPANAAAGFAEKFSFTLTDNDGDLVGGSGSVSTAAAATGGCVTHCGITSCNPIAVPDAPNDTGSHTFLGSTGDDHLQGGTGDDLLHGGAGSDHLFGGFGNDVFKWDLADHGTTGAPKVDTVHDFNVGSAAQGGDVLDLRDLLGGALHTGGTDVLKQFLDIDTHSQPGSTVLHVSTEGGFANGQFNPQAEDQRIVLDGVNLQDALCLGAGASEDQLLQELMQRNKIETGL